MAASDDVEVMNVANAFLPYYYGLFSTNRAGLGSLYQAASVLTFEGQKFVGPESIGQKLVGLPFQNVQVKPSTTDVQRSTSNGILIFVTGQLMPEGESQPLKFSHVFHLMPLGSSYVITNEFFRLNYG